MKRTLTALFIGFAVAACGGGGGGGGGTSTTPAITDGATGTFIITDPDVAPAITGVTPAPGAENVSTGTAAAVTFSKQIDPESVSGLSMTTSGGADVPGTVGTTGLGLVIDPGAELAPLSTYTVTVAGVVDIHGNTLPTPFSWSFTTGTSGDTEKPAVSYTVPGGGASGVSIGDDIIVGFSEPMNPATIENAVTLSTGATTIPFSAVVDGDGYTARITPDAPLSQASLYSFSIDGRAEDLSGNPLASAEIREFTTMYEVNRAVLGSSGSEFQNTGLKADGRGNLYTSFMGYDGSFGGGIDSAIVIASYDPHLRLRWATPIPYGGGYYTAKLLVSNSGETYFVFDLDGTVSGDSTGESAHHTPVIIAVEPDGTVRYVKRLIFDSFELTLGGADLSDDGTTLAIAASNGGALPGTTNQGGRDIAVMTVNAATGNLVNTHQFGTTGEDTAEGIAFNGDRIGIVGYVEGVVESGYSYSAPRDLLVSELTGDLSSHVYDRQESYADNDDIDIKAFSDGDEPGYYSMVRVYTDISSTSITMHRISETYMSTTSKSIGESYITVIGGETDGTAMVAAHDADNVSFIGYRSGEPVITTMYASEVSGLSDLLPGTLGFDHDGNILVSISLNAVFDEFPNGLAPKGGEDSVVFRRNPDGLPR